MRRRIILALLALTPACNCGGPDLTKQQQCNWTQWGQSGAHQGNACAAGQPPSRALAHVVFDPFVADEQAEETDEGDLLAHYPVPLVVDDDVYLMVKAGSYVACQPPGSGTLANGSDQCGSNAWGAQTWTIKNFHWNGDALEEKWTFESDWKPEPFLLANWEPSWQGAVAGDFLYVPGASGSVFKLDRKTGKQLKRIAPFGTSDVNTFVAGGLAADSHGDIFYNALRLDPANFRNDPQGLLVRIDSGDGFISATFATLVPNAPGAGDTCQATFTQPPFSRPFPPVDSSGATPPTPVGRCQTQRPGLNVVPAIGADGTVYTVSRAHRNSRVSFLVAANHDLKPKWSTSLRGLVNDGCGVLDPAIGAANPDGGTTLTGLCRAGAATGVDPLTNDTPAMRVDDSSSSSPVVLPDGVLYGAVSSYNAARGHLLKFGLDGKFVGAFDFGWDTTPAIWKHDGTYSIVIKDNHYFEWDDSAPRYFLTQLSPELKIEWQFQNKNTKSCYRDDTGQVACIDDHPDGFEWCINAPVVDSEGTVFANAEDGNLYVVAQGGTEKARAFLKLALGAAYTPLAIDPKGRIYTLNGGELTVLGQ